MSENDLVFQLLDIDQFHDDNDEYKIRLFGKTLEDKSLYVEVTGFRPHFYVEIPENWRDWHIKKFISHIKEIIYPKELASNLVNYEVVKKCIFYYFTDYKKFTFLKLEFNNYDAFRKYAWKLSNKMKIPGISRREKEKFNIFESNIIPYIRFLHIQKLNSVGWCKIKKENIVIFPNHNKPSETDIACKVRCTDIEPFESNNIHKFTILSFDLECTSCDGGFPQAERPEDEIIQIGMTYSRCGETECYKKIVLCLKETDKLNKDEGEVIWFNKEADMLLEFSKLIRQTDPDIITGYNIFCFDFPYLEKRAKLLGIDVKFARLSRIKNHICEFYENKLSSSAIGKNEMYYYITPGRVIIDLMKAIQRDHKLPLYNLQFVSSHFIKEKIIKYEVKNEITRLIVNSSYGIKKDQYISLCYNDQITDNKLVDKKIKVLDIGIYEGKLYNGNL